MIILTDLEICQWHGYLVDRFTLRCTNVRIWALRELCQGTKLEPCERSVCGASITQGINHTIFSTPSRKFLLRRVLSNLRDSTYCIELPLDCTGCKKTENTWQSLVLIPEFKIHLNSLEIPRNVHSSKS